MVLWRFITQLSCSVVVEPYLDPERTSSDMSVRAGDEVDMYCTAEGKPIPTIQWMRLGGALLPIGKKVHYVSVGC